jgi:hypothetical protein
MAAALGTPPAIAAPLIAACAEGIATLLCHRGRGHPDACPAP